MASAEYSSPFQTDGLDDSPLPPLHTPAEETAATGEGVMPLIDSPFASSLITPGLMEQLSHSITAASSREDSERPGSNPQQQQQPAAAARADAAAPAADSGAAAGKESGGRPCLQGVASILESPFVPATVSHDVSQLQQLSLSGAERPAAA